MQTMRVDHTDVRKNYFKVAWQVLEGGRSWTRHRIWFFATQPQFEAAWKAARAEAEQRRTAPVVFKRSGALLCSCAGPEGRIEKPEYFQVIP